MSSISAALNSPRFVRLLPWLAGAILAAGIVVFLIVFFGNTSDVPQASKAGGKPVQQATPRTVPLAQDAQRLAVTFIKQAVSRKNATIAYQISGPAIRQGQTLAEWTRDWNDPNVGVPIIPYDIDQVKESPFRIDFSYPNEALLEVALIPRKGSTLKPQIFFIGLRKFGKGTKAHWLVNYWGPHNIIAVPSQQ